MTGLMEGIKVVEVGFWVVGQATHETIEDPQAIAAGGIIDIPVGDGSTTRMVATPVDFDGTPGRRATWFPSWASTRSSCWRTWATSGTRSTA
jgi:crotonobetainyl-CoA:carnitine CoA-transferase CaiB-like acyl-CoA transferase